MLLVSSVLWNAAISHPRDALVRTMETSPEFFDLTRERPRKQLKLDMLWVERTLPLRGEAGANRLKAFDCATELQPLDPHLGGSAMSCGKDGPHVGAQCIDGALEILEPDRSSGSAG